MTIAAAETAAAHDAPTASRGRRDVSTQCAFGMRAFRSFTRYGVVSESRFGGSGTRTRRPNFAQNAAHPSVRCRGPKL